MKTKNRFMAIAAGLTCLSLMAAVPVTAQNHNETSQNIYRLYNRNTGEHFYTAAAEEKDALIKAGWSYEGIGWVGLTTGDEVYRLYNPNAEGGDHYYTTNAKEADSLCKLGWILDNDGQPVFMSGGDIDLYVAYNPNASSGTHNYTTNRNEQESLLHAGWLHDQVAWKVAGIGSALTDPAIFYEIAGKTFQNNVYAFAGGPSVTMVINSDGTFSETNERISDQGGSEISRFTGQLSMPEKIDDYTWKVSVVSTSMTQPAGTTISEGGSTKHVVNPFAGFYGSSEFYIASPEKPFEDYPEFFQTHANPMPDAFKNNFGDSYILYSADGTTCLGVMNPNWN